MVWDGSARLLAIVRYREPCDLASVFATLRDAGITQLEVTLDTPGALEAVTAEASAGRPVGVGTVVTAEDVTAAADAGAAFLVGPATRAEMIREAVDLRVDVVPGAFTPTEILLARDLGATAVKLFPAPVGGPAYVRALRGPIPGVPFVTTGGIGLDDIRAYLEAGANCVGLGGDLVGRTPPAGRDDLELIAERAAKAAAAAEA
jgi:2-dehydro-3-deoxyphosphogluconate aldolase / (4S)-4-hydroxy-2-oxoglutarate aldolase